MLRVSRYRGGWHSPPLVPSTEPDENSRKALGVQALDPQGSRFGTAGCGRGWKLESAWEWRAEEWEWSSVVISEQ